MLREVGGQRSTFAVVEDSESYQIGFARSYNGELTPARLYRVCLWNPKNATYFTPVYILAETAEAATLQATCHVGVSYSNAWDAAQQRQAQEGARVEVVPFGICGWGKDKF